MKEEIEEFIELTDKDGNKSKYEILDVIYRDDEDYAVLLPEGSEDEVVIFRVVPLDRDEVEYVEVTDDEIADSIFEEFVKRIDSEE
ncbi:MAG: DUF1292 domain-containing protein [Clostridia bacterium]|nr:DUF1292 domain-containing protein [Clostridia bacterium]MBP3681620.1 DUF1292 domain-containing protein [Clostridia bacterium]